MKSGKENRVLLIVNPHSGLQKLRNHLLEIVDIYSKAGKELTVMTTQRGGDAARIARDYGGQFEKVVCSGGDGTFNETVSGLMDLSERPLLGYIPAGTTNDFAVSMNLSTSLSKAAQQTISGEEKTIDIGRFNGRYFSYVASFGAFTGASYSTPQNIKNTIGHLAYLIEGVNDLSNIRPYHVRVETAEQTLEGDYLFGAVSNSTSLGGLLKLGKQYVDMNDGLFEVLLVKKPAKASELQKIISGLLTQQYDGKNVTLFSSNEVTFHMEETIPWSLDGEYEPGTKDVHIENIRDAIRIMV
ncbi:MAG: diacylglycerol kinase family lipid kinase [Clostridia bacterium]|nr:diacylglycerol kinase family lipid kinase [Clostridia bacterium]